jgi:hypothetical protein
MTPLEKVFLAIKIGVGGLMLVALVFIGLRVFA